MLINRFLRLHNFTEHPFTKVAGEKEELLQLYFVEPRYFSEALGDANHPKSYVIFGPRGGGKSAIRSMIEVYTNSEKFEEDIGGKVLSITYDDFTALRLGQLNTITLTDHVNEILKRGVAKLAFSLVEQGLVGEDLPVESRGLLRWYIDEYMTDLSRLELDSILKALESKSEKITNIISNVVEIYNALISVLNLERIDPSKPTEIPKARRDAISSIHVMETFTKLADDAGYKAVYILVDKIDETGYTGGQSNKAAKLVHPLLTNIRLLEIARGAFKFFLWENVKSHFGEELRTDRIKMKPTEWTDNDLERMLIARIGAYSLKRATIDSVFKDEIKAEVITMLVKLSFKSPRDLNRLMESIFAEAAVESTDDDYKIGRNAVIIGIRKFAEERSEELYGNEVVNRVVRMKKQVFTIPDVAATFKITGGRETSEVETTPDKTATNRARNVVVKWKACGIIEQLESGIQTDHTGRRRPVNQYGVIDPRVVYLMNPDSFMRQMVIV
ncbi:P-loop ATPase, Sll1717 family [Paenibacillus hodogayensis]|uniref:P-loop ATPase, Sll1717 family n=1 Tax=Paenibacillus hodogayensis TaxID=279208 RepID=A0ABV5W0H7_9BACL